MADYFELAAKITNGNKHFRPKANTRRQPSFSTAFSDAFARPLIVKIESGMEKSADRFLRALVNSWARWEAGACRVTSE